MAEDKKTTADTMGLVVARNQDIQVNGTNIRLSLIEGFEGLNERQKKYMEQYATNPETKTLHAMQLGYKTSEVDRWFEQEDFVSVANTIYDIYTEVLKSKDVQDSWNNSRVRSRVIKSRENNRGNYREKKEGDKHIHIGGDSFADVMQLLNGGDK